MKRRIGIIGTGRTVGVANNHLSGIQAVPDWNFAAIYDVSNENASHFARKNELPESLICNSLDEFFSKVDAATICTHNKAHTELVRATLARKLPVLCEKPLARTYPESIELAKEAEAAGVVNYMGMQYRYLPYAQIIREVIASGELGEVHYYRHKMGGDRIGNPNVGLEWRMQKELSGPGALIDFGVHQVDLLHYFVHDVCGEVQSVQADLATVVTERERLDGSGKGSVTNDDIGVIIARLENGAIATINNSRIVPQDGSGMEIVGTKAALSMDENGRVYLRKRNPNGSWAKDRELMPAEDRHKFPGSARGKQYQEFFDIIEKGVPYELDFAYGARMVRIMDAAVKSSEEGRRVQVTEID